jgi:hypothetical protein
MRHLAVALAVSTSLGLGWQTTAQADDGLVGGHASTGTPAPPTGCSEIATGDVRVAVQQFDSTENVKVVCRTGQAFYPNHGDPSHAATDSTGAACTVTYYADVSIGQMRPNGVRTASWDSPPGPEPLAPGRVSANATLLADTRQVPGALSGAQADLYHELPYVTYNRSGAWDGARCAGGAWTECGSTTRPEGRGSATFDPCIASTRYAPNPPDCTGGCEQPVANLVGQLSQSAMAGTVQRWPKAAQPPQVGAVVNLPVLFYIPDWRFNGGQQALLRQTLVLVGPPDDHGRSRVFTYLVTAGLQGVDWDFGDGQSTHFGDAAGLGQDLHPPAGSSTVSHAYARISDAGGYHVTATEDWGVRVDKYWIGGHAEEAALERDIRIAAAADLAVGQVEPIPCPGSGCG